jgi:hypothetical protein
MIRVLRGLPPTSTCGWEAPVFWKTWHNHRADPFIVHLIRDPIHPGYRKYLHFQVMVQVCQSLALLFSLNTASRLISKLGSQVKKKEQNMASASTRT